jgi:hypothetical protein
MRGHNSFGNRESHADSTGAIAGSSFTGGPVEPLKDTFPQARWNAWTLILHDDFY